MKQTLATIALALTLAVSGFAQSTWTVDNVHSKVRFSVSHLVISEVEGDFKVYTGTLQSSKQDFSDATIDFSVDVNSIDTDNEDRDKHLKADDFFAADKFPKATFKSVAMKKISEKNYQLEGDLTIRDVTKRVVFTLVHGGTVNDPWGNNRSGFKGTTTINRQDFGVGGGGAMIGNEVALTINLELTQKKSS